MKSQALPRFWKLYRQLPKDVRRRAARAYRIWQQNPQLPGLQFKRVSETRPVYSIRIGDYYRALGLVQGDMITWFWIGNHQEYEQLLKRL
jgi:mRNA-degrading endonuclease RelE of RelBE toxin-antitoxin system